MITQTAHDYVSSGPWVEKVETRVGVDTNNNGKIDQWTDWKELKESYDHIAGFSKQIEKTPATLDLTCLLYTSPSPRDYGTSRMPSSA